VLLNPGLRHNCWKELRGETTVTLRTLKCLLMTATVSLVAACRLEVMVSDGGIVISESGGRDCTGASYCINDIDDPYFNDTFTAIANPGYEFVRWQAGEGFLCGDDADVTCSISISGGPFAEAIVASGVSLYIMPVFKYLGLDTDGDGMDNRKDPDDDDDRVPDVDDLCPLDPEPSCGKGQPITDTVAAAGKEWAQPDVFNDVSAEQIATQCPQGACKPGSKLNGWAMDGWFWATVDDVNALFNAVTNSNLGPGPDTLSVPYDTYFVEPMFAIGFRPTNAPGEWDTMRFLVGLTSDDFIEDVDGEEVPRIRQGSIMDNLEIGDDVIGTNGYNGYREQVPFIGAWFYRPITP
jgi:hypothetical protein